MAKKLPGTTIEVLRIEEGVSRGLFSGIFATGGITLSQLSVMTGLEPHVIQNWVKRGFVAPPVKRVYSANQFSRIIIINMLRESLYIDRICEMLRYINGSLTQESDDLIGDAELYHMFIDMLARNGGDLSDIGAVRTAAEASLVGYEEPYAGAREKILRTLQVMAYACYASLWRTAAEEMLSHLQ